eukprot:5685513-Amphidinium_carterae.2
MGAEELLTPQQTSSEAQRVLQELLHYSRWCNQKALSCVQAETDLRNALGQLASAGGTPSTMPPPPRH